MVLLITASG